MKLVKLYKSLELSLAIEHARQGGQALHVVPGGCPVGPRCFRRAKETAHLLDQNADRLRATARELGVGVAYVHNARTEKQHVDLCGKPLQKAKALAEQESGMLF